MFRKICPKLLLIVVITILILVVSCSKLAYDFKYLDSHCGIYTMSKDGECYPIYSEEEKDDFVNNHKLNSRFIDLFDEYDADYFLAKYIVIIVMPAGSSSYKYELQNVSASDMITFEIKHINLGPGTADLVNKAFIVELSQDLAQLGYKISII